MSEDSQYVTAYVAEGSQSAFRALVDRHVSLVFATALRQVGDPGIAEEISQNVFLILAKKAPSLARYQTIAGWLHATTILESKARLRAELRRRRREEIASDIALLEREGTPALQALVPLLDEGLLHLKDPDRLVLVLRFLEDRTLRDVGKVFGIDEDAARKRVVRALDRLSQFFEQRGFPISGTGSVASVFTYAVTAAPTTVSASVLATSMASSAISPPATPILLYLMNLSKTKTALACVALWAGPLIWQGQVESNLSAAQVRLREQTSSLQSALRQRENGLNRSNRALAILSDQNHQASLRAMQLATLKRDSAPLPVYHWDDNSPFVRVPKSVLNQIPFNELNSVKGRTTTVSRNMKTILQMTVSETEQVEYTLQSFLSAYRLMESQNMRPVPPSAIELQGNSPEKVRSFEITGIADEYAKLSKSLLEQNETILGAERAKLFNRGLNSFMRIKSDEGSMITPTQVAFENDHRITFYQPEPNQPHIRYGLSIGQGGVGGTWTLDEIPEVYRIHLREWINEIQKAAGAKNL